jgi:hypothetical protein
VVATNTGIIVVFCWIAVGAGVIFVVCRNKDLLQRHGAETVDD